MPRSGGSFSIGSGFNNLGDQAQTTAQSVGSSMDDITQKVQDASRNSATAINAIVQSMTGLQSAAQHVAETGPDVTGLFNDLNAVFKPLDDSFSTSVIKMIQGTQTWQQTASNLLLTLIKEFVSAGLQMATSWAAAELSMTASTQAGTATRTAAQAAGSSAGLAETAANAQTSILQHAGSAAAATFDDVAQIPVVGYLLAPAAAVGAFAAVAAFGSAIPSAAGGWDVPGDSLAMIHKNEMVLPSNLADRVRGMTEPEGSGGSAVHLHVNAVDGQSVKRLFQNNGAALASVLRQQQRNFAI